MNQQPFLPKDVEYQALRRFVKMVEASQTGSMTENMASALAEELTPRQQQMVHMYYICITSTRCSYGTLRRPWA